LRPIDQVEANVAELEENAEEANEKGFLQPISKFSKYLTKDWLGNIRK